MKVFVTDGENRAALAVARSLGRAGHEVIVGEKHAPSLAQTSRFCSGRVVYPDPVNAPDAFVESLADVVRDQKIEVLIPIADITTFLATRHRDMFDPCALPFAPANVIERAADKVDVVRTAMRLGIPVPRSLVIESPSAVPVEGLEFPLVIKPWRSRLRTATGWVSSSVSYAIDRDALMRDLSARPAHEFPVMLQERIEGPGTGVFACYHNGHAVALFSHRRIRERPPWGGVSVLSESVPISDQARDYATRLLDELKWHGVAMVEFKHDVRDDLPKLMEINGRFWGSLQLAVDAGVDFPRLLVQTVSPGRFDPQPPYRVGVQSRWLWGDFDSLLLSFRRRPGGAPNGASSHPLPVALEFAKFWGKDLHYENPRWDDPRPGVFETVSRLKTVLGIGPASHTEDVSPVVSATDTRPRVRRAANTFALRSRVASRLQDTGLDAARWNAIVSQNDTNSVFQTHQWVESWWSAFKSEYEPLLLAVEAGTEVVGIAPLVIDSNSSHTRTIRFLGDQRADYCDFLLPANDRARVLGAMFDAIRDYGNWNVIQLNNIPSQSDTTTLIDEICQREGYHLLKDDQFVCPTLLIQQHRDNALAILNKPSLRRRRNYFQKAGRLVERDLTTAAEVEPYLDAFFNQHIARWQDTKSPSLFLDPRNRDFYRRLTRTLSGTGWLLFSVIEFNGQPIAFHYGFDYADGLLWYKPSFDIAQAAHSPGMVMLRHLIEYAITKQRRELDFTLGDEAFKKRFTNEERKTVQLQIFKDRGRYLFERSRRHVATAWRWRPA